MQQILITLAVVSGAHALDFRVGSQPIEAEKQSPLHVAAERGDEELAKLLLTAMPDLTVCDTGFNATPLGWARHFNRAGIVALIEGTQ